MISRLAVLADAANVAIDGKLNILGEFNLIIASAAPCTWPRMFLVIKLEAEPNDPPQNPVRIRVLEADGRVIHELQGTIDLGQRSISGIPPSGHAVFEIRNAVFTRYGHYEFEIMVGQQRLATIPLYVLSPEQAGHRS